MAGSATITGKQYYVAGIGHPASESSTESAPAMVVTDPLTGGMSGLVGIGGGLLPTVLNPLRGATSVWRTIGTVTDGGGRAIAISGFFTPDIQVPIPDNNVYAVQLVLGNLDTAGSLVVDAIKVAAADKHLTSTGTQLTWSSVTTGGATAATVPAAASGVTQVSPGLLLTDVIPLRDIARTDGGTRRLLRIRALMSGGGSGKTVKVLQLPNNFAATWNADSRVNGMQVGGLNNSVDAVTTTSDGLAVVEGGTVNTPVLGVIFYSDATKLAGVAVGDSLVQGNGSSAGSLLGWPQLVTMLGNGVSVQNFGSSGQRTIDTLATLKRVVTTLKPRFVAMKSWSPNDGTAQTNWDSAWANFLEAAEFCRQNQVVLIGMTSSPVNGFSAPSNVLRNTQNAKTLALAGGAYYLPCDIGAVVQSASDPTQIAAAYNSDGTHLTDAGYSAQAAYFDRVVRSIA